jgi:fatty-acyl-CoA synthase
MTIEYDQLTPNKANYVPLSPISFLHRTADIYPDQPSLIYHDTQFTWSQTRQRCVQIASALAQRGIGINDTVSVLAFNTPEMFECHFSVAMAGGVLNAINTRLDADTVAYIIDHAESKLFIVDRALWPILEQALASTKHQPQIIVIDDPHAAQSEWVELPAGLDFSFYPDLVNEGDADYQWQALEDEWQALSLNYTSGTTGRPKGVVYHHRGSYLMTMGTIASWNIPHMPRYLYSVPMFHCNGWGHAWTMAAKAATVVCLRAFEPKQFFELLEQHEITHFGGAPIVLNMLANAPAADQKHFKRSIQVLTAGAPPPASVLQNMAEFGFDVMHVYGLTETYGHILQAAPQLDWAQQSAEQQAELKSRQGVRFAMTEAVDVIDHDTGLAVPHDGQSMGEIVVRGNIVMKGYLKDTHATETAFQNGWFNSGDLAVIHADGYIQIKDRAKDIIISGGENISSVEVENILYKHPAVGEAAVVAMADEKWGEVPCAFIELKPGQSVDEQELIDFCSANMARFKKPKKVVFGSLPKTATGKIQKTVLRDRCKQP